MREGFEGPEPAWRDVGGDARYTIEVQQRVQAGAHSGTGCEYVQLNAAAAGRSAFVSYSVGRAPIIAELRPSLWVRADRQGVQMFVRVVMPRAIDTKTQQPLTMILAGDRYASVGAWQELAIADVVTALTRQAWVLRQQLRSEIDLREAYIDRVMLNVYTGPGRLSLWIDDLVIEGVVQPGADAGTLPLVGTDGKRVNEIEHRSTVELNGSVLLADGRPFFPRAIEHNGEPLKFLRERGFNTVKLASPPTSELLDEARREGLWLISPPLRHFSQASTTSGSQPPALGPAYDRVLAWDAGSGLARDDLEPTRDAIERIRQADPQSSRPILCEPDTELYAYSRSADVIALRREPLGTSFEMNDYDTWLRERMRLTRPGTPAWAIIQTQLAPALRTQFDLLTRGAVRDVPIDADQIRALAFTALAAGVNGLCFRSDSRLDANDPVTQARAADLELINLEFALLEPWTAAGRNVTNVAGRNHAPTKAPVNSSRGLRSNKQAFLNPQQSVAPDVEAFVLQTDRARLLLPIWSGGGSQFVASQWAGSNLSFVVPGVSEATDVYQITPNALRPPFKRQRVTGGIRVTLDEFCMTDMVVLTQDPLVLNTLVTRTREVGRRSTDLERQRALQKLQFVMATESRMTVTSPGSYKIGEWLADARSDLAASDQRLQAGDVAAAFLEARRAHRPLQRAERAQWEEAIKKLTSPLMSPLAATYATLPEHYRFMELAGPERWGLSELRGGAFESLDELMQGGWQHLQNASEDVEAEVELSSAEKYAGRLSLRLAARATDETATDKLIEAPPVWLKSPPIAVERGQWVRIRGWVYVPTPVTGSVDGLMIVDSMTGEALAERIGEAKKWQPFTMLRVMPESGNLSITIAMTGLGEAWIDDLAVERVLPPNVTRQMELQKYRYPPEQLPTPTNARPLDARQPNARYGR